LKPAHVDTETRRAFKVVYKDLLVVSDTLNRRGRTAFHVQKKRVSTHQNRESEKLKNVEKNKLN
jgi:hypothetical protein